MIEDILKFFTGELKRLDTHHKNQMRGYSNKIKNQRRQLITNEKSFKSTKIKTPKTDLKYREYCLVKDEIINKLNEKIPPLIEGNNFRDGHIGKLKAKVKLLEEIETNLNKEIKVLYEERERGDNPEWDCTDAAHPAWWRGERYSYLKFCERVTEFLDGKGFEGKGHVEIERVKRRIEEMLINHKSGENMNAILIKTNADLRKENEKWQNQSVALSKASTFKKDYSKKWNEEVARLTRENEVLKKEKIGRKND